jgi:hypothetical protein
VTLKNGQACSVATYHALKTDTQFLLIETLEKMARALEVPMYRLFHDGEAPTSLRKLKPPKDDEFGSKGGEAVYLSKLRRLLAKMKPSDQNLLLHMAQEAARG